MHIISTNFKHKRYAMHESSVFSQMGTQIAESAALDFVSVPLSISN
jgi:hypothetical protein